MFTASLKIALRALYRRRNIALINIVGLALGMTVFLFLMEYAGFHASFDRFHEKADRIFHVVATTPQGSWNNVPPALLGIKEFSTDVEATPALMTSAGGVVQYKPENGANTRANAEKVMHKEETVAYGNNDFFSTFTFPFLAGSSELDKPNTMVITASTAQKYFACGEDYAKAIGKRLIVTNQFGMTEFTVSGVIKDIPEESKFRGGTMIFSLQTLANPANLGGNSWAKLTKDNDNSFLDGYVLLKDGAKLEALESVINGISQKTPAGKDVTWHLQPLKLMHLGDGFNDPLPNDGMLKLVVIAGSIALFVLALALINYINLSTAFGLSRAREIGVRKTIGASKMQLIIPYFTECMLLTAISLVIALASVELLQKPFNTLVGAELGLRLLAQIGFGLWGWVALALGTVFAGGYVAFVLSGVNPIVVMKGNFAHSKTGVLVRKGLVVVQFAITIAFIIGTIVVFEQLRFMRNRDLGMNLDQVLVIEGAVLLDDDAPGGNDLASRAEGFKNALRQMPFVRRVSGTQVVPSTSYNFRTSSIKRPSGSKEDEKKSYSIVITDDQYFNTFEMSFIAGKAFTLEDNLGDFHFRNVVINDAAREQLGFRTSQEAIGQPIQWGDVSSSKGQQFQIGGIVKNYHHQSLKNQIDPIIFLPSTATAYFATKISTENLSVNLASIEALYKKFFPENQYTAKFADELFQKQYENDARIGRVFAMFTVAAICIACLGLFGLVAYSIEMRTKEIGVRKVLGATNWSIMSLLSKDFLKLVGISCLVAMPVAWYLMNAWLTDFAYHLELRSAFGVMLFAGAGIIALGIAFIAVGGRALQAARGNVVAALRSE